MSRLIEFVEDSNGRLSSSRGLSIAMVLSYLVWGFIIVLEGSEVPDIPLQLAGLAAALYGINKISSKVNK